MSDTLIAVDDGEVAFLRRVHGGSAQAVLVLPDEGQHIRDPLHDRLYALADERTTLFLFQPRRARLAADIDRAIRLLREQFPALHVIARGRSASVMLERERDGRHVDGMVLLTPVLRGEERGLLRTRTTYELGPVRVQTPTVLHMRSHEALAHPITGTLRVRAIWREPGSAAEAAHQAQEIRSSVRSIIAAERPIRFSTRR